MCQKNVAEGKAIMETTIVKGLSSLNRGKAVPRLDIRRYFLIAQNFVHRLNKQQE